MQVLIEHRQAVSACRMVSFPMKKHGPEYIEMGSVTGIAGQWVLVVKDKVIASSDDALEIFKLAEKYPEEDTVVTKILHPRASFY